MKFQGYDWVTYITDWLQGEHCTQFTCFLCILFNEIEP